jgi:hypothetical protein
MGALRFLVVLAVLVFAAGFVLGFFLERSAIAYTSSELDELKSDIENMQLLEMFISSERVDCQLMFSTMGSLSYNLNEMVNRLKATTPETAEFWKLKKEADFLSLRAWILSKGIRERCTGDLLPMLYIYSIRPECEEQEAVLQNVKEKYPGVLVYAIDFYLDEPTTKLVRDAYGIEDTPAMIIGQRLYGQLSEEELEGIVCGHINCTS